MGFAGWPWLVGAMCAWLVACSRAVADKYKCCVIKVMLVCTFNRVIIAMGFGLGAEHDSTILRRMMACFEQGRGGRVF